MFITVYLLSSQMKLIKEHIRSGGSFVDDTTCGATNNDSYIPTTGVEVEQLTESEEK
jgi:hypothetical protein